MLSNSLFTLKYMSSVGNITKITQYLVLGQNRWVDRRIFMSHVVP